MNRKISKVESDLAINFKTTPDMLIMIQLKSKTSKQKEIGILINILLNIQI